RGPDPPGGAPAHKIWGLFPLEPPAGGIFHLTASRACPTFAPRSGTAPGVPPPDRPRPGRGGVKLGGEEEGGQEEEVARGRTLSYSEAPPGRGLRALVTRGRPAVRTRDGQA